VVAFIGQWATDGTGVTDEEYAQGMKNSDIEMNTRYMWKCVCRPMIDYTASVGNRRNSPHCA